MCSRSPTGGYSRQLLPGRRRGWKRFPGRCLALVVTSLHQLDSGPASTSGTAVGRHAGDLPACMPALPSHLGCALHQALAKQTDRFRHLVLGQSVDDEWAGEVRAS
ncbi:MAG: hypothetical protein QOJ59_1342 [Thermomicrobiales bacterium]|nr:hypothetical protein [Thermomicrobiales bacterium]